MPEDQGGGPPASEKGLGLRVQACAHIEIVFQAEVPESDPHCWQCTSCGKWFTADERNAIVDLRKITEATEELESGQAKTTEVPPPNPPELIDIQVEANCPAKGVALAIEAFKHETGREPSTFQIFGEPTTYFSGSQLCAALDVPPNPPKPELHEEDWTFSKTLDNVGHGKTTRPTDMKAWGDPDAWQLICKASSQNEGWMKSTKAMKVPGAGVLVQVTTQQRNPDGSYSVAEALTFIPGVSILDLDDGTATDIVARRLVDPSEMKSEQLEAAKILKPIG